MRRKPKVIELEERLEKTNVIVTDLIVLFSLLIKKGIVTNEELIKEHNTLNDANKKNSETDNVQPKG